MVEWYHVLIMILVPTLFGSMFFWLPKVKQWDIKRTLKRNPNARFIGDY